MSDDQNAPPEKPKRKWIGPWKPNPNSVYTQNPQLPWQAKAVWPVLLMYSDRKLTCSPSYENLMEGTSLGRNTVAKGLNQLEAAGFIRRIRRHNHSNIYMLTPPLFDKKLRLSGDDLSPYEDGLASPTHTLSKENIKDSSSHLEPIIPYNPEDTERMYG